MKNYKAKLSEKQIRADQDKKTSIRIAQKLCPPFSQDYFAKDILGLKSRQTLNNWIRRYGKEDK